MADDPITTLFFSDDSVHQPPRVVRALATFYKSFAGSPMTFEEQQALAQALILNGSIGVRQIVGGDVERARSIVRQIVDAAVDSQDGATNVAVKISDPGPTFPGVRNLPNKH